MQEEKSVETLQLFKEIKAMGYNGGRSILYDYLKPYISEQNAGKRLKLPCVSWVASKVSMLLCRQETLLSASDKELFQDICEKSEDIKEARILVSRFREMMENKQGHLLKDWIDKVSQSYF